MPVVYRSRGGGKKQKKKHHQTNKKAYKIQCLGKKISKNCIGGSHKLQAHIYNLLKLSKKMTSCRLSSHLHLLCLEASEKKRKQLHH